MQSSDKTPEAADETDEAPEPQPYHCHVVAQLHAREKISRRKRKRPVRKLLGKRTNAILDKHGLRRIIPTIELFETECNDDKYEHYTVAISFEAEEYSDELMAATADMRDFLLSTVMPRFFSTRPVLEATFDMRQGTLVKAGATS